MTEAKKNDVTSVKFKVAKGKTHTHRGVDYGEAHEALALIDKLPKFKADRLVGLGVGVIVNG